MSDKNEDIEKVKQSLIDELDAHFAEIENIRKAEAETIRQKDIKIGELQKEIVRLQRELARRNSREK